MALVLWTVHFWTKCVYDTSSIWVEIVRVLISQGVSLPTWVWRKFVDCAERRYLGGHSILAAVVRSG